MDTGEMWRGVQRAEDQKEIDALKAQVAALEAEQKARTLHGDDIELLASEAHEAYLRTSKRLGWGVKLECDVPYAKLSEDAKELDRAMVLAVIRAMLLCNPATTPAPS